MENCPICHEKQTILPEEVEMTCTECGQKFLLDRHCENGHCVCGECRRKEAVASAKMRCLSSKSKNPVLLLKQLTDDPAVNIHGPEHHILVPFALLTAYCNANDSEPVDLGALLDEANERATEIPGGACGYWGSCGAAIASGIFLSIITDSDPFQEGSVWADPNRLTAKSLNAIADIGGPRCCKRNSHIALREAVRYANDLLDIEMEQDDPVCTYYPRNEECLAAKCPFFPK